MISSRVAQPLKGDVDFITGGYAVKKVRGLYRVYADATEYSQVSGQVIKLGKVQRDCDDRPVEFASVEDADKWVKGGMIISPAVQFGATRGSK